jgi:DNA-binding transcriptional MocR family regulator
MSMTIDEPLVARLGEWREPGVPLAAALAAAVRSAVLDGRLRTGGRLPAERRLAAALGVSRGTVTTALAMLRDEGWVHTRHGSASTVRLPPAAASRIAPRSATGEIGAIDLRHAVSAAPHTAYQAAMTRAADRAGPVLSGDGELGPGLPELRALIAARYTAEGLPTRPANVLITSGARAALALLSAHLRPRVAAVEVPTYFEALACFRAAGTRLVGCPVGTDGWDLDQLGDAFRAAAGGLAYLIPDFQSPTGALMTAEARRVVAELADRHGVTVVADEIMRDLDLRDLDLPDDLTDDLTDDLPDVELPDVELPDRPAPLPRIRRSVLIGSAGKTIWGGVRVGWLRTSARLVRELADHPLCPPLSAAPMQQLVAIELLRDPGPLLRERRRSLRHQRDHLSGLLAGDPRWRFTVPQGGLALWLRLTTVRAGTVVAAARERGLELSPGPRFSPDGTLPHHLRLPFTPPPGTLDRVAAVLAAVCP